MKKLSIIPITGYCRSGKDTVAMTFLQELWMARYNATIMAMADPIRDILGLVLERDIEDIRSDSPGLYRRVTQNLGAYGRMHFAQDFWARMLVRRAKEWLALQPADGIVIVPDVRYPEELELLRDIGVPTPRSIWVARTGTGPVNDHESEAHYDFLRKQAEIVIENNSDIESLHKTVREYLPKITRYVQKEMA